MPERNAVVAVMALISDQKTQSRSFSARESTCSRCLSLPKDPHTDEHVGGGPYEILWQGRRFWGEASGGSQFGSAFFAIPGIGPVLVAGRPLVGVDRGSPVRRRGIWRFERNRWAALWPGYSEV